jgi:hypothetical protein
MALLRLFLSRPISIAYAFKNIIKRKNVKDMRPSDTSV